MMTSIPPPRLARPVDKQAGTTISSNRDASQKAPKDHHFSGGAPIQPSKEDSPAVKPDVEPGEGVPENSRRGSVDS
jgi:hypothetical protein